MLLVDTSYFQSYVTEVAPDNSDFMLCFHKKDAVSKKTSAENKIRDLAICPLCGFHVGNFTTLLNHIRGRHYQCFFVCVLCLSSYLCSHRMYEHMKCHDDELRHNQKGFRRTGLKFHLMNHKIIDLAYRCGPPKGASIFGINLNEQCLLLNSETGKPICPDGIPYPDTNPAMTRSRFTALAPEFRRQEKKRHQRVKDAQSRGSDKSSADVSADSSMEKLDTPPQRGAKRRGDDGDASEAKKRKA